MTLENLLLFAIISNIIGWIVQIVYNVKQLELYAEHARINAEFLELRRKENEFISTSNKRRVLEDIENVGEKEV
jgi:hypothetical protein